MFITIEQIKAARALLRWNQKKLAAVANLNDDQVHNFESGRSRSLDVLEAIYKAFTMRGIDFVAGGVVMRENRILTLQGIEGFAAFRNDVLNDAKYSPLDICVSNVDETRFDEWGKGKVNDDYFSEMKKLKSIKFRILVKKNDYYIPALGYASYKWLPEELFGEISFYVYGNKTAIISFEKSNFTAFIICNERITEFYRKEFNQLWDKAYEINKTR